MYFIFADGVTVVKWKSSAAELFKYFLGDGRDYKYLQSVSLIIVFKIGVVPSKLRFEKTDAFFICSLSVVGKYNRCSPVKSAYKFTGIYLFSTPYAEAFAVNRGEQGFYRAFHRAHSVTQPFAILLYFANRCFPFENSTEINT